MLGNVSYFTFVAVSLVIVSDWVKSVGSRSVYELNYRKFVFYVLPIQNFLGKLQGQGVPVGDTATITHHLPKAGGCSRLFSVGDGQEGNCAHCQGFPISFKLH